MLGAGGGKDPRDLAHQRIARPEPAGLVEEGFHLPGHHAEERRRAQQNGVIVFEIGGCGFGRVIGDKSGLLPDRFGNGFGYAAQVDMGAGHAARAFGLGFGQSADMAIAGVIKNKNAGHGILLGLIVSMPGKIDDPARGNKPPALISVFTPVEECQDSAPRR